MVGTVPLFMGLQLSPDMIKHVNRDRVLLHTRSQTTTPVLTA